MGDLLVVLLPEMFGLIVTPGAIAGCVLLLLRSRSPVPSALAFGGAFVTVYTLIALAAILGGASDPGAVSPDTSHGTGLVVGVLFLLGWAARTLPIGTAYAVWVGIGALGAAILGAVLFNEPVTLMRVVFLAMLLTSIVGLKMTA